MVLNGISPDCPEVNSSAVTHSLKGKSSTSSTAETKC